MYEFVFGALFVLLGQEAWVSWAVLILQGRGGLGNRWLTYTSTGCVPVRDDYFSNATGFTCTSALNATSTYPTDISLYTIAHISFT